MGRNFVPIACAVMGCKRLVREGEEACDLGGIYCDDCDGCGWVEGGATIKTTCAACKGAGVLHLRSAM